MTPNTDWSKLLWAACRKAAGQTLPVFSVISPVIIPTGRMHSADSGIQYNIGVPDSKKEEQPVYTTALPYNVNYYDAECACDYNHKTEWSFIYCIPPDHGRKFSSTGYSSLSEKCHHSFT